ncbi:flagellar motor switch protein FliG [Ferroacidibacillus organovorans]|uniref:Flagellar motor switch protein FliG n=1 Tax=Ferroacidibacillus organovorans TaxID=1765683 RepID=A0A1V4ES61_9BACL|nr:flagellar motor switch protein FliG [Ferroacidibacillus organovorans]OPG15680.1 flagellar motor switch protein FliG [Ferroacidibacillus organovorans]
MSVRRGGELSGKQKAALLLISLGPETAANVYKHLREEEIEKLTLEIASVQRVEHGDRSRILEEFQQLAIAEQYISEGGIEYAREILQKALGKERALELVERLTSSLQVRPFEFARKANPLQILNFIQTEHPQTIALVLSYLEPKQAAGILAELPQNVRYEVAMRIATMDSTSPEVVSSVERVLESKLASMTSLGTMNIGGLDALVQILNGVDRSTERGILDYVETTDPELAEEIKRRMFIFEDIVMLDPKSVQRVIRDIEQSDLQLALRTASEEVKELVFSNMSKRMVETFKEDMEFAGPVRLRDVEEAQQRIVAQIRRLEDMGEIVIRRGGSEDVLV